MSIELVRLEGRIQEEAISEYYLRPQTVAQTPISDADFGPALWSKLARRAEAGLQGDTQPQLLSDAEWTWWTGGVLSGVGLSILMAVGAASSASHAGAALAQGSIAGTLITVAAAGWRLLYRRHSSLRLTWGERETIAAAKKWTSPHDWQEYGPPRQLVEYAIKTIRRILASPSWQSSYLDEHRLRLNLVQEINEIDEHAFNLAQVRAKLGGRPVGNTEEARRAQKIYDWHLAVLDPVWRSLLGRVKALVDYAGHLAALDESVANLAALDRFDAAESDIAKLLTAAVLDEFATERTRELSAQVAELRSRIVRTLSLIRSDVSALEAIRPKQQDRTG